jgi:hypothetical protein
MHGVGVHPIGSVALENMTLFVYVYYWRERERREIQKETENWLMCVHA